MTNPTFDDLPPLDLSGLKPGDVDTMLKKLDEAEINKLADAVRDEASKMASSQDLLKTILMVAGDIIKILK